MSFGEDEDGDVYFTTFSLSGQGIFRFERGGEASAAAGGNQRRGNIKAPLGEPAVALDADWEMPSLAALCAHRPKPIVGCGACTIRDRSRKLSVPT